MEQITSSINPFDLFQYFNNEIQGLKNSVLDLRTQLSKPIEDPIVWFDMSELRSYLPEKPAKPTVYEWCSKRLIPYHKRGKKSYFLKAEIDEWLKSGRKQTRKEIHSEALEFTRKRKGKLSR